LLALVVVSAGWAAEYYVDREHPQASDGNPGSEELPWRTIQQAAERLRAGDTVWIKAGR
jgi:hypothetical protein